MLTVCRNYFSLLFVAVLAAACSVLPKPTPVTIEQYVLEYAPAAAAVKADDLPLLLVTTPDAHGGYDTRRIAYLQQAYSLRYYTRGRWADTPARMLAPLIADAAQATGQFQAVHKPPGSLSAGLRLDTELVRFHQDFTRQPSAMRITLRAQLIDIRKNNVIATRQFDMTEPADSDDTYGGVVAANRAIAGLLDELTQFCIANRP